VVAALLLSLRVTSSDYRKNHYRKNHECRCCGPAQGPLRFIRTGL